MRSNRKGSCNCTPTFDSEGYWYAGALQRALILYMVLLVVLLLCVHNPPSSFVMHPQLYIFCVVLEFTIVRVLRLVSSGFFSKPYLACGGSSLKPSGDFQWLQHLWVLKVLCLPPWSLDRSSSGTIQRGPGSRSKQSLLIDEILDGSLMTEFHRKDDFVLKAEAAAACKQLDKQAVLNCNLIELSPKAMVTDTLLPRKQSSCSHFVGDWWEVLFSGELHVACSYTCTELLKDVQAELVA
eukprot:2510674-Amphidinium_carterae.3